MMSEKPDGQFKSAARLIAILDDLDAGKDVSLRRIENRFSIRTNAAREYIQFLATVRPLADRMVNGEKRWSIAPRDPTERAVVHVAALELALGALEWLDGTEYYEQLRTLRREVAARVAPRDRDHVDRFVAAVRRRPFGQPTDRRTFTQAARALLHAIREHHPCEMRYRRLDGTARDYKIEPLVVLLQRDRVYVLARKQPGAQLRIFELEGIEEVRCVDDETFVRPSTSELNPDRLLDDSFGIYIDVEPPHLVRVLVRGPALVALRRRRLHASQAIGASRADGWTEVTFRVSLSPPLRQWVLGWIPDVRVLEPAAFRDDLRAAAHAFAAGGDPSGGAPDPRSG